MFNNINQSKAILMVALLKGVLEILCQSDRIYNSKGLNNESNT